MVFGTVRSIALSKSRRRLSSRASSSSKCRPSVTSISSTGHHICVLMYSTGEDLSTHSADDPRGARAVWKLGVVGLEHGHGSTGHVLNFTMISRFVHGHASVESAQCVVKTRTVSDRDRDRDQCVWPHHLRQPQCIVLSRQSVTCLLKF